jgi:hypothetical protein
MLETPAAADENGWRKPDEPFEERGLCKGALLPRPPSCERLRANPPV